MNLYLRLLILIIKSLFNREKADPFTEIQTNFRVLPNDLDLNMHMNNGRYLTIMDLGRFDFMSKTGILKPALKKRWLPVLGAAQISFLRPLKLFQKYQIRTRLEYWDEKWFIMSQKFFSEEKLIAVAKVRGQMRGPKGLIKPETIVGVVGGGYQSPPLTEDLKKWIATLDIKSPLPRGEVD